tara:strand:+ start:160 stop:861 length:702 start_codon:yes stop_codon:yes gene_type:complete
MKNKNEKGFALILAIVLLLAMSLMGGSLIVISAGDHRSNNSSDQYQQAFYVAETALIEGEKSLQNAMMGNWVGTSLTRDIASAALPRNTIQVGNKDVDKLEAAHDTACVRSYRNITRTNFKVAQHVRNQSFYKLIRPIITSGQVLDDLEEDPDGKKFKAEENYIKKFYYEYFSVFIGNMDYKGPGSSIKKTSTNVQTQGSAYKIYGCGIMRAKDSINSKVQILIPLESIVIFN